MYYKGEMIVLGGTSRRKREIEFLRENRWKINVISLNQPKFAFDEWFPISLYDCRGIASVVRELSSSKYPVECMINCSGSKLESLIQLQYFLGKLFYTEELIVAAIDKRFLRLLLSKEKLLHTRSISDLDTELIIKPVVSEIGKKGVFYLNSLRESDLNYFDNSITTGNNSALIFEEFEQGEDISFFFRIKNNKIIKTRAFNEKFTISETSSFDVSEMKEVNKENVEGLNLNKIEQFIENSVYNGALSICGKNGPNGFVIYELGLGYAGDDIFNNVKFFPDWKQWL